MRFLLLSAVTAASLAQVAHAGDLTVAKDQSMSLKLDAPAATIVVGNPAIADVTMQDSTTGFVTGKNFGTTNIIAVDGAGREVASYQVTVNAAASRSVTLIRGQQTVTLSCTPRCETVGAQGANVMPSMPSQPGGQ